MKIVFLLRTKRNNPINAEEKKLKSLFSEAGGSWVIFQILTPSEWKLLPCALIIKLF
jgi:hypothetical protein